MEKSILNLISPRHGFTNTVSRRDFWQHMSGGAPIRSLLRRSRILTFLVMPFFAAMLPTNSAAAQSSRTASARDAVLRALRDPQSAIWGQEKFIGDFGCIEVNAKNGFGGYAGAKAFLIAKHNNTKTWHVLDFVKPGPLHLCMLAAFKMQEASPTSTTGTPRHSYADLPTESSKNLSDSQQSDQPKLRLRNNTNTYSGLFTPEFKNSTRAQCAADILVFSIIDSTGAEILEKASSSIFTNDSMNRVSAFFAFGAQRIESHPMAATLNSIANQIGGTSEIEKILQDNMPNIASSIALWDIEDEKTKTGTGVLKIRDEFRKIAAGSCSAAGFQFNILALR